MYRYEKTRSCSRCGRFSVDGGGADSTPFGVTALCVALGIALLFASERVYISKIRIRAFKKTARRVRPQKAKAVPAARKAPAKPVCRVKEALADMETA